MNAFIQAHASKIIGMISGWDRVRFRGTVRMLANVPGLERFLKCTGRLLKDFKEHVVTLSRGVRAASLGAAERSGRPVVHLQDPGVCKEDLAREIQRRDGIKEGLICVLTAVEPCWSFNLRSNRELGVLELEGARRKCQHLYHYMVHPAWGFMHVRLQTWLPMNVHVCINGREWLSRQMDAAGIEYVRRENCFAWISDVAGAQELLWEQVRFNWEGALGELIGQVHPGFATIQGGLRIGYYWSVDESEWASDVMFKNAGELSRLYGRLIRHGMESLGSREVLRFLGRRVERGITPRLALEVTSDLGRRAEGIRIKHRVGSNSVKMYNKEQTVLRVETTINRASELKAPRARGEKVCWERMCKGVGNIDQRAAASEAANQRYMEAMSAVEDTLSLQALTEDLAKPVAGPKLRARGLNLLGREDARLLEVVGDGTFLLQGFRNGDLQRMLYDGPAESDVEKRRRSGQATRKLRLLRAHGLIEKIEGTHRYMVCSKGRQVITALQAARAANVTQLAAAA